MKKLFTLCVSLLFICSCSGDLFDNSSFAIIGSDCQMNQIEGELIDFVKEHNALNVLGLELQEIRDLTNEEKICLGDFFNLGQSYLAYDGSTLSPVIINYSTMRSDTCLIHYNFDDVEMYIKEKLISKNNIYARELMWSYNNKSFSTIALFDKETNELLYDNILFNVLAVHVDNKTKRFLNRSENMNYINENITFIKDGNNYSANMVWGYTGSYIDMPGWNYQNGPAPKVYKSRGCHIIYARAANPYLFNLYGVSVKTYLNDDTYPGYAAIGSYRVGFGAGGSKYYLPTIYTTTKYYKTDSIGNGYSYQYVVNQ